MRTRIAMKALFVVAHRFEHDAQERWEGGRLVRLDANDVGASDSVHAEATEAAST